MCLSCINRGSQRIKTISSTGASQDGEQFTLDLSIMSIQSD